MIAPAPVIALPDGMLRLDVKFVEGMKLHCQHWEGEVTCLLRSGADNIPFAGSYHPDELGFDLHVLDRDAPFTFAQLTPGDLIFAGADMVDVLHLADRGQKPEGVKLVYAIEYDLATRLKILQLDQTKGVPGKLRSGLWLLQKERLRRTALRKCDAIQFNGYPAERAYGHLNKNTILYLDGRVTPDLMATSVEQQDRQAHLQSGAPLRIVHSGRLEPMKGAQDLIPVAKALDDAGCGFSLDIFGSGSLSETIARQIAEHNLSDKVRLHGAVDFEIKLVPFLRQSADVFLSCHRQSDPSCTYLETLSCGVPIVGYANAMWQELAKRSNGGWALPLARPAGLSRQLFALDKDRGALAAASQQGLAFAKEHAFDAEFAKRMRHLKTVAQQG